MKIVIVIPAYNEEAVLEKNIKELMSVVATLDFDIHVVISDNNSKDKTAEIGKRLAGENEKLDYVFVGEPGKGSAVMEAWKKYDADIYGFMDADLAVDLKALDPAIQLLDDFDVVIGSRRIKGSEVDRELYRRLTSRVLNLIVNVLFKLNIKDTPCGFKFFKKQAIDDILPKVKDRGWVFDTEMLILAKGAGFKIKEIPVKWVEKAERGSRVNIYPTASGYIKELLAIKKRIG